jgi:hypothetical protein
VARVRQERIEPGRTVGHVFAFVTFLRRGSRQAAPLPMSAATAQFSKWFLQRSCFRVATKQGSTRPLSGIDDVSECGSIGLQRANS